MHYMPSVSVVAIVNNVPVVRIVKGDPMLTYMYLLNFLNEDSKIAEFMMSRLDSGESFTAPSYEEAIAMGVIASRGYVIGLHEDGLWYLYSREELLDIVGAMRE